jgi:hypothetical protein
MPGCLNPAVEVDPNWTACPFEAVVSLTTCPPDRDPSSGSTEIVKPAALVAANNASPINAIDATAITASRRFTKAFSRLVPALILLMVTFIVSGFNELIKIGLFKNVFGLWFFVIRM